MTPEQEEDGELAFTLSLRSSLSRVWSDPRIETQRQEGEGSSMLVSLETPDLRRGWPEQEEVWGVQKPAALGHVITTDVSTRCGVPVDSAVLHLTFCRLIELGASIQAPRNASGADVDP